MKSHHRSGVISKRKFEYRLKNCLHPHLMYHASCGWRRSGVGPAWLCWNGWQCGPASG